jgi:hypothetical protein
MEGRTTGRRGVAILAVAILAAGALAASSAGAAAPLTKKRVKKIATKVFNSNIGPATAGFLGNDISRHQASSPNNSTAFKNLSVDCPAGKYAISGGGWVAAIFSDADPGLTMSTPSGQNPQTTGPATGWTVSGQAFGNTADSWSLQAVVICATP